MRRPGRTLARVGVAVRVDGRGVIATIGVIIKPRLEPEFLFIRSLGQCRDNVVYGDRHRG